MNRSSAPPPPVPQPHSYHPLTSPYAFGYPPPPSLAPPFAPRMMAVYKPVELVSGFDPRATAALMLGILSLVTGAFAGIPAFILGSQARRDEERIRLLYPHVPRRVAGVALAGMLCGVVGTLLGVALIAGTGGYWFAQHQLRQAHPAYAMHTPSAAPPPQHVAQTSFGTIRVVDLAEDDALPFRDRLKAELKTAHDAGHPVLVETTAAFCGSCDEIDAALHQDPLQHALAGATLVRVDVETFEEELRSAGMWQDTVPWFYRLDSNMRPTDAISADEWDENTAENIAKVLGPFAHGMLPKRRAPSPLTTSL